MFELGERGLVLKEIAPGIDLKKDILDLLDFEVEIAEDLVQMDERIFHEESMDTSLDAE